jgi:hypothetical protein
MDAANVTTVPAGSIDYRVLADPDLSYFSIQRAHAYGMNDEQIAQAAKLAHYAEVPMSQVLNLVEDGRTMTDLAIMYGVNLDYLANTSDWQDRIHDYMVAYHNTGMGALRNGPMEPTVASYSSTGFGPAITPNGTTISPNGTTVMPNGTTVAPNGTTVTPDSTTTAPNGTTVTPNGTTVAPDGTTSPGT